MESNFFAHKDGCLGDPPGCAHRSPIECTTRETLEMRITYMSTFVKSLEDKITKLKAEIYDLKAAAEEYD